jgi:hypothetical protein
VRTCPTNAPAGAAQTKSTAPARADIAQRRVTDSPKR